MLGHLIGEQAGRAGHQNVRRDDRRRQTVVDAGRSGLYPAQLAAADHSVPINRAFFGMAAVNVGAWNRFGNSLLTRIDDLGPGRNGRNPLDVRFLGGIAQDNSHNAGHNPGCNDGIGVASTDRTSVSADSVDAK